MKYSHEPVRASAHACGKYMTEQERRPATAAGRVTVEAPIQLLGTDTKGTGSNDQGTAGRSRGSK